MKNLVHIALILLAFAWNNAEARTAISNRKGPKKEVVTSEKIASGKVAEKVTATTTKTTERASATASRSASKPSRTTVSERASEKKSTVTTPMDLTDAEFAESEAVVDFYYGGVVNASISARFVENEFMLPVTELFYILRINQSVDARTRRIRGKFGLKQIEYSIDGDKKQITFGDTVHTITAEEVYMAAGEVYLNSKVYKKVFGWDLQQNLRSLSVSLITTDDLPILAERRREMGWQNLQRMGLIGMQAGANSYYPLLDGAGISRPVIDGGGLGYGITSNATGTKLTSSSVNLNGGFRLLGGDAQINGSGSYLPADKRMVVQSTWQWRFALEENNWLQSITVGVLGTQGAIPMQIQGGRITNEPLQPRIFFDFTELDGTLPATDWLAVEVLRGSEVMDYKKLDSTGVYSFSVPRFQGVTIYTVRKYGRTGEVTEDSYVYNIPVTNWQPGKFIYTITGGRDQSSRLWSGNGTASIGITDWLTNTTGADYQYQSAQYTRPLWYNTTHLRLLRSTSLTLDVINDAMIRATSQTFFASAAIIDASYSRFNTSSSNYSLLRNFTNAGGSGAIDRSSLALNVASPLGLLGTSARISGIMDRTNNGNMYQYTADVFANISTLMMMASYRGNYRAMSSEKSLTHFLTGSFMYSVGNVGDGVFGFLLNGSMMSTGYSIDLNEKKVQSVTFNMSRPVYQSATLGANINYSPLTKVFFGALNLSWNLDVVQASAGFNYSSNGTVSSNVAVQGAMSVNPQTGMVSFASMNWIGSGGAAFRPFIDENGNGLYDVGERVIDVHISPAFGGMMQQNGEFQTILGMPSYSRVNATIDEESLANPMYIPKVSKFSFYAEPNTFKAVDIPFVVAGSVEGMVNKVTGGTVKVPLSGLRLRVKSPTDSTYRKTILTFTDGTFLLEGVPPGEYTIEPDTNQLALLGATASPSVQTFTVKRTQEGDYLDNVNFDIVIERTLATRESKKQADIQKQRMFYIALATAATREQGDSLALQLAKNFGFKVTVQSIADNSFVVTTGIYDSRQQVDSMLSEVVLPAHYGQYTVVDPDVCSTPTTTYRLLLNSFEKRSEAEKYIADNSRKYSGAIDIDFMMATKKYTVVSAMRYATYKEAESKTAPYSGSFREAKVIAHEVNCGTSAFSVIANSYKTYDEAETSANSLSVQSGIPLIIWFDKVTREFIVSTKKNIPTRIDADKILELLQQKAKATSARVVEY